MTKHDVDFHAWATEQADALTRRSANELDWDNLARELETLAKSAAWELYSRYVVLLTHLLKWAHQPGRRSRSWQQTITVQRLELAKLIRQNPSLKAVEAQEYGEAFATARHQASAETHLRVSLFPVEPPFTPEQARTEGWLPADDRASDDHDTGDRSPE